MAERDSIPRSSVELTDVKEAVKYGGIRSSQMPPAAAILPPSLANVSPGFSLSRS
jgi:hypothetical protein